MLVFSWGMVPVEPPQEDSGFWGGSLWGAFPWGGILPGPPPPGIPEALTREQIVTLITAPGVEVDFGAQLLDSSDVLVRELELLSGTVEHQNYADVHGSLKFQISEALPWDTARIRPWQKLTGAGLTKTWPLGVYLLIRPETKLGETPITYDVLAYDKLKLLQKPVGDAYFVASGTGYLAAVRQAITDSGATGVSPLLDGTAEETVLDGPMVWVLDPGTKWIEIINALLKGVSYRGLYANATGRYCSEPYQSPLVRAPLWGFDTSDLAQTLGEEQTLSANLFQPYNYFRFVRNGMTTTPSEGAGVFTVDNSGTDAEYRYVAALDVADQAALVAAGDAEIQVIQQVAQTLVISAGPAPFLGHFDVFNYRDLANGLDHKCQAHSWQMPLEGGMASIQLEVL